MILYNVTINIDHQVEKEWLQWMKEVHIPDVMNTGLFIENKICRILAEEEGGSSYSIQYICKDMPTFQKYENEFATQLRNDHKKKYDGKFAAFRTLLEIVHQS